jgi:hypothetical protein
LPKTIALEISVSKWKNSPQFHSCESPSAHWTANSFTDQHVILALLECKMTQISA